ncbi:3-oxoacyl-ACP reductase [Loigolactobacillus zhaoyuanensis]|uniref:3-oxoacyl-ACP reductase n=1 Tax=Loigolactobacillus zhaoyuanensis TaxID=2486017 RepID=A0ABW8U8T5_9LACO|nr:3-oxoacyl-ACP reductase [Loigolactobacillus zhaoyuanensis]
MANYPELIQQHAFITGVASGIGHAQAVAFLAQDVAVFGIDRHVNPMITQLQQQYPQKFYFEQVDVRDAQAISDSVAHAIKQFGQIELLLNTAGILDAYKPLLDTDLASWNTILATNLTSQFLCAQALLPQMLQQQHGVIINMASIAGLVAGGGGIAYTAAKHGVIGLTKQIDYDYAASGIRANCIAPGAIDTPMNAADFLGDAKMAHQVALQTPAQRWAQPEEVAALSLFLASSAADYIHGSVIPIDGGWLEK